MSRTIRTLGELHLLPDGPAVARALAELFIDIAATALADRGRFTVALAGGNTPRATYALLATPEFAERVSWSDVYVYFGDERCVPPDDEQSNFRMAQETLLGVVPIPEKNIHRMRGEIDPSQAAQEYAQELTEDLGIPPRFDLVMLGMGPDGHTASLFPGADPQADSGALVRGVYAQAQLMWRITLTPTVINAARNVVFAVEGAGKAETLAAVREGTYEPTKYPSQIVAPFDGRLIWLVDSAAAGSLKHV